MCRSAWNAAHLAYKQIVCGGLAPTNMNIVDFITWPPFWTEVTPMCKSVWDAAKSAYKQIVWGGLAPTIMKITHFDIHM